MEWTSLPIAFTVADNEATFVQKIFGPVRSIMFIPPTAGAYDVLITGPHGETILAETSLDGFRKFKIDDALQGDYTFLVTNAPDGAWVAKVTWINF